MKIPAQYAKAIAALVGQVLLFLQWKYGAGNEWVMLATGIATVLGVAGVTNAPQPPPDPPAVVVPPPPAV